MGPRCLSFMSSTARRKPSRSRAALPGRGGPIGRSERNGKSKRSTVKPEAAKASDISTSSFDWQFAPAPCVSTIALPPGWEGSCKKPRIGGSSARSTNGVDIEFVKRWTASKQQRSRDEKSPCGHMRQHLEPLFTILWWRRGESNPRPKSATTRSLHAYLNSVCDPALAG